MNKNNIITLTFLNIIVMLLIGFSIVSGNEKKGADIDINTKESNVFETNISEHPSDDESGKISNETKVTDEAGITDETGITGETGAAEESKTSGEMGKTEETKTPGEAGKTEETKISGEIGETEETKTSSEMGETEETEETGTTGEAVSSGFENSDIEPADMDDALFIGDSRTVGIMEYAGIDDADFFCSIGMSVFNVCEDRISVSSVGKVSLEELLSDREYGKIYIMLGINELGYGIEAIVEKYKEFVEYVKTHQPEAEVFIQANLHVSKKRSEKDKYINNEFINELNSKISEFADGRQVFFLDANHLFDDSNGNLDAKKTADDAHLLGRYYVEWGEWIGKETANILRSVYDD